LDQTPSTAHGRATSVLIRYRTPLAILYFAIFVTPLVLASLTRPFGFWDYLTVTDTFHYGIPVRWSNLFSNYWLHLSTGNYILRPTTAFLYDLQVLLFGGKFWIWYTVKWSAFFAAIALAVYIVRRLGCGWAAQISVVSLLLFHHARFTLMLHAPDGWVALGVIAQLALLAPAEGDIAKLGMWRYAALLFLSLFTVGAKETGYLIQVALLAFVIWNNARAIRYFIPLVALVGAWTVRLAGLRHRAAEQFSVGAWVKRFFDQMEMLVPGSPDRLLDIFAFAIAVFACALAWRWRREYRGRLIAFALITTLGVLAFTTMPPLSGLRYGIPAIFILSVPFGLAVESLGNLRQWVTGLMIGLFPILTAGQIYTQELAYDQQFYACAQMLNILDRETSKGATLTMTQFPGDLGGEFANTVKYYFGSVGAEWYGVTPRTMHQVNAQGWPETRFVMLSMWRPEAILKDAPKPLAAERLERVIAVMPGKHSLSPLQERFSKLDELLRVRTPHLYDYGAPTLNGGPVLYIYLGRAKTQTGDGKWIMEEITSPK